MILLALSHPVGLDGKSRTGNVEQVRRIVDVLLAGVVISLMTNRICTVVEHFVSVLHDCHSVAFLAEELALTLVSLMINPPVVNSFGGKTHNCHTLESVQ